MRQNSAQRAGALQGCCVFATIFGFVTALWAPVALATTLPPENPASRPPLRSVNVPTSSPRAPTWVGEHLSVLAGTHFGTGGLAGPGICAGARAATLLQIVDAEFRADVAALEGGVRVGAWAQINLHPAFIAVIWRNWWGLLASGAHVWAGVGVTMVRANVTGVGVPFALGVGLDVPLSSLEHHAGLWLTTRAGMRWLELGDGTAPVDAADSVLSAAIAWRWYDVFR